MPPVVSEPVQSPPPIEEQPLIPEKIYYNNQAQGGEFPLPLHGACGFAGISLSVYEEIGGTVLTTISPGQGFTILQEQDNHWKIALGDAEGWVEHKNCFINLPDVIPSIIYDNPYASLCTSCSLGKDIPNVTGFRLYDALFFHGRFQEELYLTPVLYQTAKKINKAQELALADGYSLLIYECFRPATVQSRLVTGLAQLMNEDQEVYTALTTAPWSKGWFVSGGVSKHQRGIAVDLTLVEVQGEEIRHTGDYEYLKITDYVYLDMPTQFDELSPLAATYTGPSSHTYASTMTPEAILLQDYCTTAGLEPLASEWWHFSDTYGGESITGDFLLTANHGIPPLVQE